MYIYAIILLEMNQYQAPTAMSTMPTRQQIILGQSTAGPLTVLMVKHPVRFWISASLMLAGIIGSLVLLII